MDLRTKLVLALVAVSLGSMFALVGVVVPRVEERMREVTLEELEQLAESKGEALEWIIQGWRTRAELLGTDPDITEAELAAAGARYVQMIDENGFVRGAGPGEVPFPVEPRDPMNTHFVGWGMVDGGLVVAVAAALQRDAVPVGTVVAWFDADEVGDLTGHFHGLGESGELLIVAREPTNGPMTLHPTRHRPRPGGIELPGIEGSLAVRALAGEAQSVWEEQRDYRGQDVWAATRPVPQTGWGVIVKIDVEEQAADFDAFVADVRQVALVLAAFTILIGFGLGLRFGLPVTELAEVADRIRKGDMAARARVRGEDEVGVLARTFNEMATEIEEQMSLLHNFRKFFDVAIEMMCIANTDGYFERVNSAFTRVLGWSEDELKARPFIAFVHPDDVASTVAEVEKLAQGIPTISFENRYLCKDGSYKRLHWSSYPEQNRLYAIARVLGDAD